MGNIKVKDLTNTSSITTDNHLMVLTNDENNVVQNITVENFLDSVISSDADNGISIGLDDKLYVNNSDSGVTAGTYQYPQNLVVDAKGKITSVVSGSPGSVPIATSSTVGIVKPDNSTITVVNDGTITANIDISGKADVDLSNLTSGASAVIAQNAFGEIHEDINDFTKIGAYWHVENLTSGSCTLPQGGYWFVWILKFYAAPDAGNIESRLVGGIYAGGTTFSVDGTYPHFCYMAIRIKEA